MAKGAGVRGLPWGVPSTTPPPAPVVDAWDQRAAEPTTMLRAALRPRMLGLLVLLLAAAAVCGLLGAWQLGRAELRGEASREERAASLAAAAPVPLASVLAPQTSFRGDFVGRKVAVRGTYESSGQVVVPDRVHDGAAGFLVLTPLRVSSAGGAGEAAGAVLPVVRGWVATAADASPPPEGPVDVVGFLQASEQSGPAIAEGRSAAISSAQLVGAWGGPIYTGYLVLSSSTPPQDAALALLAPPTMPGGSGMNLQNLAYAAQWWIFGGFAVLLWLRMVRDEARGGRSSAPARAGEDPADEPEDGAEHA